MARRFFKSKSSSVQEQIDSLRRRQKQDELETSIQPPQEKSAEETAREEQEYLRKLETQLKGGGSPGRARSRKFAAPTPPPSPPASPAPLDREDEPEVDPFEAEREVDRALSDTPRRAKPLPPPAAPKASAPEPVAESKSKGEAGRENEIPIPSPPLRRPENEYERQGNLPYPPGTIVRLSDDSVGIIREEILSREYDLVYFLCANGRIEPRGVLLSAYELLPLGRLPREELKRIDKKMSYDRDRIIYHLTDIAYAAGIPKETKPVEPPASSSTTRRTPPAPAAAPVVPEPFDDGESLQRGRSLTIVVGDKSWNAVYWGEDSLGKIVAHRQNGEWELMHLNLGRFGDSLKPGPLVPQTELKVIEEQIVRKTASPKHKR